jgi:hypothetical protein
MGIIALGHSKKSDIPSYVVESQLAQDASSYTCQFRFLGLLRVFSFFTFMFIFYSVV